MKLAPRHSSPQPPLAPRPRRRRISSHHATCGLERAVCCGAMRLCHDGATPQHGRPKARGAHRCRRIRSARGWSRRKWRLVPSSSQGAGPPAPPPGLTSHTPVSRRRPRRGSKFLRPSLRCRALKSAQPPRPRDPAHGASHPRAGCGPGRQHLREGRVWGEHGHRPRGGMGG